MYITGEAMIKTTFTGLRRNAKAFFDAVENGDTVQVTRYGRPVAEIVPPQSDVKAASWNRPALRLSIKGISLSR